MEPLKEYSGTKLSLDNCIIPTERLVNTPSCKDGCDHKLEVDLRIVGCEYIQSAGLLLRLPQVAMATAQVLFQRFYYGKSFVKYSVQPLAMASIFVAAKIEENFRRLREVINVFHHLKQKRMGRTIVPMEFMGDEYFKLKSSVIKYERFLLKELGFCVHVKHPHKLIVTYLQMLEVQTSPLVQKAWNNMNDSLRTNVFVRFSPESIACACIFLAARQLKVPLPLRPPWWKVFGAEQKDLEAISLEILALYSQPRNFLESLEKEVSVLREKLARKQDIIKEITVIKATPSASPSRSSPIQPDKTEQSKEKVTSQSPLTVSAHLDTKPPTTNPSPLTHSSQPDKQTPQSISPLKNGMTTITSEKTKYRKRSHSVSVEDSRMSAASDHSGSKSPDHRPIKSPIKCTDSSEEDHSDTVSLHLMKIPRNYRPDYDESYLLQAYADKQKHSISSNGQKLKSLSKHHASKYKSRGSSRESERRREQYRHEKDNYNYERDREVFSSYRNRHKHDRGDDRDYHSSSKVRKSEHARRR